MLKKIGIALLIVALIIVVLFILMAIWVHWNLSQSCFGTLEECSRYQ